MCRSYHCACERPLRVLPMIESCRQMRIIRRHHVSHKYLSLTGEDDHDAAKASTACTAIYNPGTLKVSNIISAVYSRFSGGFMGGSIENG